MGSNSTIERNKARVWTPEMREKVSNSLKVHYSTHSDSLETREKKAWAKGKKFSAEHRRKIGAARKGIPRPPHVLEALRVANVGRKASDESRAKMSAFRKGKPSPASYWWEMASEEEKQAAIVKAIRNGARGNSINRPNRQEKSLMGILENLFPGEYQYVGDGGFILGGRCPDFLNVNGQKKLVELFGDYWHEENEVGDRISYFSQFGFSTLIIWESELQDNRELVVARLRDFHKKEAP